MDQLNPEKYNTIIFDLDGVLFDSNQVKSDNILRAAKTLVDEKTAAAFVDYFTGLNGVPREVKINHYFKTSPGIAAEILATYNRFNENSIYEVRETPGMREFLSFCSERYELVLLSGGASHEINRLLENRGLAKYFKHILGGPAGKTENLQSIRIKNPCLYIGDSKVDYETAQKFGFDFVFMHGFTQWDSWATFFSNNKECFVVENLSLLHEKFLKTALS